MDYKGRKILLTHNQIINCQLILLGTELPNAQVPEINDHVVEITIGEDKGVWIDNDEPVQLTQNQIKAIAIVKEQQARTEPPKPVAGKRSDKKKRKPAWDIAQ
jgi:hypothetical protein